MGTQYYFPLQKIGETIQIFCPGQGQVAAD
jgi:hypothetical protein